MRINRIPIHVSVSFFFFQAEDGIRDLTVTGVQTCALPIYAQAPCGMTFHTRKKSVASRFSVTPWTRRGADRRAPVMLLRARSDQSSDESMEIGRASCRERV